jgi:antirestriction protein ArdC
MKDVYKQITDDVIQSLQDGKIPWKKGWVNALSGERYHNEITKTPYGVNNCLWLMAQGCTDPRLATFKQWTAAGYKVKAKSKAFKVCYANVMHKAIKDESGTPVTDENGNPAIHTIPYLKEYSVFSADQIEDYKPREYPNPDISESELDLILNDYFEREGITYKEIEQNGSYYDPVHDEIVLPEKRQFKTSGAYYQTKAHEAIHSTGAYTRLDRDLSTDFGSHEYSKEELTAEIGSAFLLAEFGLSSDGVLDNSKAYISSWIEKLQNNPRWIVSAASKAEKAVKYILEED